MENLIPAPEKRGRKSRLTLAAKIVVTLALCALLVSQADWSGVVDALRRTSAYVVLAAFVLMMGSIAYSAYKWRLLLAIHGISYPFSQLHRFYYIAGFFNNFLPTSIGGDGYRIYKTLGNERSKSSAVIAVVVERLTGVVALLIIGYVCGLIVFFQRHDALSGLVAQVGTIGIALGIPMLLLLWKSGVLTKLLASDRLPAILKSVVEHFGDYAKNPAKTRDMIIISFIFQIHNSIAFYVLLVYGVGAHISIPELLIALTLVNVIAVLPVSINGLGVVDGSFIYLTGFYGVPYDAALAVMLLSRGLLIILSVIGAGLYFGGDVSKRVTTRDS